MISGQVSLSPILRLNSECESSFIRLPTSLRFVLDFGGGMVGFGNLVVVGGGLGVDYNYDAVEGGSTGVMCRQKAQFFHLIGDSLTMPALRSILGGECWSRVWQMGS